jgi:hypothetical protein
MFIAIGVGIYVRFKGIGKWPLADDEYYIAKSVQNILVHGIPKYECGGYYVRGLLYQYMAAPFLYFFSNDEFYLRIIPAFSNILGILPLYWIGKRLSGVPGACIAVLLFCFSLWEIELSRFARMYCPFQTIFLWYLVFLWRVIIDKDKKCENWMHLLSITAIFIYEASIFLLVLNFITLILIPKSRNKFNICIKIMLFILGYLYLSTDFRHLGVEFYLPPEIQRLITKKSGIALPNVLITTLLSNSAWKLIFIIPLFATIFVTYKLIRFTNFNLLTKIGLCAVLLLSLLNLFGLAILLSAIMLLLDIIARNASTKNIFKQCLLVMLLNFIFWGIYCFATTGWHQYFGLTQPVQLKRVILILFNYPDFVSQIIYPWMWTMPVLTIFCAFIVFLGSLNLFNKPLEYRIGYRILLSLLLILCALVAAIPLTYHETRYTFFLYPIIILLVADTMARSAKFVSLKPLKSTFVLVLFTITFICLTEDFGIDHMKRIDKKEINFRLVYRTSRARHYYNRMDYRSPALLINDEIEDNDIVISLFTPVDYYLKRIDYNYIDLRSGKLPGVVACEGTKDLWSNSKLIFKESNLWHIVDKHPSTVWIIAPSETTRVNLKKIVNISQRLRKISHTILQNYNVEQYKTSVDGLIDVYKIDRK